MNCPVCGQASLAHGVRDLPYAYDSHTLTIPDVEADWCPACGECLTGPAESERVMQSMAKLRDDVKRAG
jgi:HTH-type transcriptional regulator/antitoxin MqsA